ncbi:MAG: DUF3146 family protein [Cyanobacteriota bacterium]|jgi:hypothetical protein|nr:DUF3146 family protein [Cyanobacteriota bacterium]
MGASLPETVAQVRVTSLSWHQGLMCGDVQAGNYHWEFQWQFRRGKLRVWPSLGRALIYEPLGRFLERSDYQLEPGSDYELRLRSQL